MSRRSLIPKHRRHVRIYDEDWDYLQALITRMPRASRPGIGNVICLIVHARVRALRARDEEQGIDPDSPQPASSTPSELGI